MAKAVRFDHYGDSGVLYLADVEVLPPAAGEVTVAVRAAGINPGEASIRNGYLDKMFPTTFPSGEGSDFAGVVTEIGDGVSTVAVGDEVLGWSDRRSSHAEYVAVPVDQIVPKPAGLSWEAAGSLYVAGVTAYAAVRAVGAGPGDIVGVSGAAGGVGSIVVQLAQLRGADVVAIASEANHEWLASLGARPVAYGDGLAERIRAAAPSGLTAFVDTFGEDYVALAVELGVAADRIDTIIAFEAAQKYGVKTEGSAQATTTEVLAELADLAADRLTVPIAATFLLADVRAAYDELEERHTRGKIVLIP